VTKKIGEKAWSFWVLLSANELLKEVLIVLFVQGMAFEMWKGTVGNV